VVKDMYEGSITSVKSICEETENFRVRVGVHQGSALSSYLFSVVIDEITKGVQGEVPWYMMLTDDIVLIRENKEEVNQRLEL